jgi:hypothetical protein
MPTWNRGQLLELSMADRGSPALRLMPVTLDRRGFPHAPESQTAQR